MTESSCKCFIERDKVENGLSRVKFHIDDSFFSSFENSELRSGDCDITIDISKSIAMLKLNINIKGSVTVDCDRCLEPVSIPFKFDGILLVKESSEVNDSELQLDDKPEDTLLINPSVLDVDLDQYLFDSINLSLPIQRVHPVNAEGLSECSNDMLSRFTAAPDDWDEDEEDDDNFTFDWDDEDWSDDEFSDDDEDENEDEK